MTFYKNKIKVIDVEPTSYCNAKCPHCMRESRGGDYSFFKQVNLSKDFFEIYFSKDVVKHADMVSFSGNIGEPAMNKHLLDIIKWFRSHNPEIFVEIYTNGSVQKPSWWYELGKLIGTNGNVIFALDGLEDTNHIYRVDVKWEQAMCNIKEFIRSGSVSTWQFIPFKHNQHQVEEAESLSKQLGFKNFKIKISHRTLLGQPQHELNQVEMATDSRFIHQGTPLNFSQMVQTEKYLNSVKINCHAIEQSNVYITADGLVFPCCHTASILLVDDNLLPIEYTWVKDAKNQLDKDEISLYKNNIEDIIKSPTFNRIKSSWNLKMNQGRNAICSAICGKCNNSSSLIEGLLNAKIN